jgi:alkylation response protein AidB-like acyl-CoA dehydrogenase
MPFYQDPPRLANQWHDDELLRGYLERKLGGETFRALTPELTELGELAVELARKQHADRENEPTLTQWDPWGNRVDRIEVSPLWREAQVIAAERGLVATGYEKQFGEHSRVVQFARNFMVQASLDVYSCPLAMTDGAARTLLDMGNQELIARALPRLTSRDPKKMWTSGQWMTEKTGGSDVGLSETVARRGDDGQWRLHGTKWFTSATTAEMALTLGRPEGNGAGGKGLALFYLETKNDDGSLRPGILVNRLKDKLGTRKVPTAELTLDGAVAVPVAGLESGVRNITPMLNVTRLWNAMGAAWGARRAVALVLDYARRRWQFGAKLADKPLHVETMAGLVAEQHAVFLMAFKVAELMGRAEAGVADEREQMLWRVVTPLAKLTTGKQVVALSSEALECFGGAGYVEDTGLPLLLRDAQVLSIWEGTTNVLSLDTLRALGKDGTFEVFEAHVRELAAKATHPTLEAPAAAAVAGVAHARSWLEGALASPARVEAGARGLALTMGRSLELALLVDHAQWCLDAGKGDRVAAAARRFARHGVDQIAEIDEGDARTLTAASS